MFSSSVIEVAIGLSFIFLLLSLICSAIVELIESVLKNRATDLERGIRELFNQDGGGQLAAKFYNHPLINGLYRGLYKRKDGESIGKLDYLKSTNLPSYIPAKNFANAILDIVLHPPATANVARDDSPAASSNASVSTLDAPALPTSMEAVRLAIKRNFGSTQFGRAMRTLAEEAGTDLNAMRSSVETWFNGGMDRVSGNYKRRTQWIIFFLGLILAVTLNVNTIELAKRLSSDSVFRSAIVAQAGTFVGSENPLNTNLQASREKLDSLGLQLGWPNGVDLIDPRGPKFNPWQHLLLPLFGWLITAGAISLGAPFWFDFLNKFMVVRATVKPHEKSLEEGSEDRQTKSPSVVVNTQPLGSTPAPPSPAANSVNGSGSHGFTPEPALSATPDAEDNESHIDEGEDPILDLTPDENLPAAEGGVR
jgi:hypothetical protein